jgi:trans-aconitate methyltransferase
MKNQAIIDEIGEAKSVADVGCGEGFLTNWLIKHYPKVTAVDIEDNNRMNLNVVIADITEGLPIHFKAEVVIASEVLEHIRWWKDALQSLLEASERKLIITIPYGESYRDPGHINFWDDESVKEFIELCPGWDVKITKIITKPEDVRDNYLLYLICLTKSIPDGNNTIQSSIKLTSPILEKQSELVI